MSKPDHATPPNQPTANPGTAAAARTGVLLALLSAVTFSTVGLFTKGVDASAWEVIFWRGITAVGFTFLWLSLRGGFAAERRAMGPPGWMAALVGAIGTAAFIPSMKPTTIANVTLIWSSAPLLTALIAWIWLREVPARRVMIAGVVCLIGVALVVGAPSVGASLAGDALAMVMTVMMSLMLVIYRRWPDTPAAIPAAMSSVFLLPPALLVSAPFSVSGTEIFILLGFGLIFAVASVTIALAAQRIPASTVTLIGLLEMPLAVLWGILFLGEILTWPTAVGAGLILAALLWSQRSQAPPA